MTTDTPAPDPLVLAARALEPFSRYFVVNDLAGRDEDWAIEVPLYDLRPRAES